MYVKMYVKQEWRNAASAKSGDNFLLLRLDGVQEVAGSNPVFPTIIGSFMGKTHAQGAFILI